MAQLDIFRPQDYKQLTLSIILNSDRRLTIDFVDERIADDYRNALELPEKPIPDAAAPIAYGSKASVRLPESLRKVELYPDRLVVHFSDRAIASRWWEYLKIFDLTDQNSLTLKLVQSDVRGFWDKMPHFDYSDKGDLCRHYVYDGRVYSRRPHPSGDATRRVARVLEAVGDRISIVCDKMAEFKGKSAGSKYAEPL